MAPKQISSTIDPDHDAWAGAVMDGRPDDPIRAALLDAARHLLEEGGPDALTVRAIAAEAGVSTMNVYSRFGGRDGIVNELYREGFHRLRGYLAKCSRSDDPVENFRAPGVAYRHFALENRGFFAVMFLGAIRGYTPSQTAGRVGLDRFDELTTYVGELMDDGEIVQADPHNVATSMWATCHGHVALEMSRVGPVDIDWEARYLGSLDALRSSMS